jgi:hypothetical protein
VLGISWDDLDAPKQCDADDEEKNEKKHTVAHTSGKLLNQPETEGAKYDGSLFQYIIKAEM